MKQYFNLFDFTQKSITERKFYFNGCYDHDSRILIIYNGFPPLVGLYAAFIMGLVTAILEVDLEWYLAEQGNSDCFNCFDEVKRLRICICSCSFSRSNSNFDFLFKLGKIHKASSAAQCLVL
jgi:hypothetical protein